jgi:hypothetical protein
MSFPGSELDKHDATLAAGLGLDVETYRMLKQLEEREITPEDYELLGRLDEPTAPKTLQPQQLRRFPTEVYNCASSPASSPAPVRGADEPPCLALFGVDFWRLPLSLRTEEHEEAAEAGKNDLANNETGTLRCCSSFGVDYWRLPILHGDEGGNARTRGSTRGEQRSHGKNERCAVCCVDFEEGDLVRRLQPCGHLFHKECIDHWLLEASTRCPVDNQELCC